ERVVLAAAGLDLDAAAVLDARGWFDEEPRLALVLELGEALDRREVGLQIAGPVRGLKYELRVLGHARGRVAGNALLREDRRPDLFFEEGLGRDALFGLLFLASGESEGREGEDRCAPNRSKIASALLSMHGHG